MSKILHLRDDGNFIRRLLDKVNRDFSVDSYADSVRVLLIYFYRNKRYLKMLSDDEKFMLFSMNKKITSSSRNMVTYMAHSGYNIREKIKRMCMKNIDSNAIFKCISKDLESETFNFLGKKEINNIKKINNIKFYDTLKEKIISLKNDGIMKSMLWKLNLEDVIKINNKHDLIYQEAKRLNKQGGL